MIINTPVSLGELVDKISILHIKNINIKDLDILEFWDFNEPKEWFTSVNNPWEKLTFRKACEVWNIFHLWTKYSEPFWLSYLDQNNKMISKFLFMIKLINYLY